MNNKLVEEISGRIEAIMMADAGNKNIPRINQPKAIACVNAKFRIHVGISSALLQGIFLSPLETFLNSLWIVLKALRLFLSANFQPRVSYCSPAGYSFPQYGSIAPGCNRFNPW